MMCWGWIDSSRNARGTNDLVSRTRHSAPSAVHGGAWTKNRENNPMQSRGDPGSRHSCCATARAREKNAPSSRPQPNLIPLQVTRASISKDSCVDDALPGHLARRCASRFCPAMTRSVRRREHSAVCRIPTPEAIIGQFGAAPPAVDRVVPAEILGPCQNSLAERGEL
jgi:hypothetical protein